MDGVQTLIFKAGRRPATSWANGDKCIYTVVCGQLILMKISKIGSTRYQILRLNTPNSISAGAPSHTRLGELSMLPRSPSCI